MCNVAFIILNYVKLYRENTTKDKGNTKQNTMVMGQRVVTHT